MGTGLLALAGLHFVTTEVLLGLSVGNMLAQLWIILAQC